MAKNISIKMSTMMERLPEETDGVDARKTRRGGKKHNTQQPGSEEIGKDRARSGDDEARRLRPSPPLRAARKQEVVKYNRIF